MCLEKNESNIIFFNVMFVLILVSEQMFSITYCRHYFAFRDNIYNVCSKCVLMSRCEK